MWTSAIFDSVYSRIKANGTIILKPTYSTINFNDVTPSAEKIKYPCVVIKELLGNESGKDFEGTVNGVWSSFQIEVMTNTKMRDARKIADVCFDLMNKMGYRAIGTPIPDENIELNDYRVIARYRRNVGSNDVL